MTDWQAICRNTPEGALVQMIGANFPNAALYAAQAELIRRADATPCTNLYKWRKEMQEGKRNALTFDALWRLAADEAREREHAVTLRRAVAPPLSHIRGDLPFEGEAMKLKGPIYVAGPMSHYPSYNDTAFDFACMSLRNWGYEVMSPHENGTPGPEVDPDSVWAYYMRLDVAMIAKANLVVVLEGWECSRGAKIEVGLAHSLHIPVLPLRTLLTFLDTEGR